MSGNSTHKDEIRAFADRMADKRDSWIDLNAFYYEADYRYMRFLVPEGQRILDLGCGTGRLLNELRPSYGIGVDLSPRMIEVAKESHPDLEFHVGDVESPEFLSTLKGPFDAIILSDTFGHLEDCMVTLENLHSLCGPKTRIIIAYYSPIWEPVLKLGQRLRRRMPNKAMNWLSLSDIVNLLEITDFQFIKCEWRQLVPLRLLGLGSLINWVFASLPFIRRLCLRDYVVARSLRHKELDKPSTSVVVPCRNEKGNIESAVCDMPSFCDDLEIIFVEGHSQDGTWEEVLRVKDAYPDHKIKCFQQTGKGKADAVWLGFDKAEGDVLMILDADLTVPPENLPKFYKVIAEGKAEFVNGTRLIYPMEDDAMRFLNYWANNTFAVIFSYLLNQTFTDTLCGTKVMSRETYQEIVRNRAFFGDFDPFGDFDLIFGAAKLNKKILEVPIRYASRSYGTTQISRFSHGWLLLKMVWFALFKFKVF